MIAGIEFARCHEARCHGTSATVIQPENTPYFYQLNVEILQSIPNTVLPIWVLRVIDRFEI